MAANSFPTLAGVSPSSFEGTFVDSPSSKVAYASNEEPSSAFMVIAFEWVDLESTKEKSSFATVKFITTAITASIAGIVNLAEESSLLVMLLVMKEQQVVGKIEDSFTLILVLELEIISTHSHYSTIKATQRCYP